MLETTIKQQVILTAAILANGDESQMASIAEALGRHVTPGSGMMAALDRVAEATEAAPAEKPFPGTLIHVDIEESSKRGVIFLRNLKGEVEVLRTDRTDSGPKAMATLRQLQGLVGHSMVFVKRIEQAKGSTAKVRILDSFQDKGLNEKVLTDRDEFVMDWETWDNGTTKPKTDNLRIFQNGVEDMLPTAAGEEADEAA